MIYASRVQSYRIAQWNMAEIEFIRREPLGLPAVPPTASG